MRSEGWRALEDSPMSLTPRLFVAGYPRECNSSGSGAGDHASGRPAPQPPVALRKVALFLPARSAAASVRILMLRGNERMARPI
jgi:hypothetical protein